MNTKLSKLMKLAILINVILILIAMCYHGYTIHKIYQTNEYIVNYMNEHGVIKETAIYMLQKQGIELHLYFSSAIFSMSICIAALIVIVSYAKTNSFFTGFFAAFFAVFSNYIGGFLLFYIFLSGRSEEVKVIPKRAQSNEWQSYIHDKALLT